MGGIGSEFTCEVCTGTFKRVRSDADLNAEFEKLYGEPVTADPDDVCFLCNSCWAAYESRKRDQHAQRKCELR